MKDQILGMGMAISQLAQERDSWKKEAIETRRVMRGLREQNAVYQAALKAIQTAEPSNNFGLSDAMEIASIALVPLPEPTEAKHATMPHAPFAESSTPWIP